MTPNVGICALAVKYPSVLRTNNYWRTHHPQMVANAEAQGAGKVWTGPKDPEGLSAVFDTAMGPYLSDPFRGTVARRVVGPNETALSMEVDAAARVLRAAAMNTRDIDLIISVGFQSTSPGCGNGVYIAHELGFDCPAINLETCCSGAVVGFQTACGLITAGQYQNILVTVSCTYSIQCEPTGNLSWTSGDGAAAFVVGPVAQGAGFLGGKTINTAVTVGAMYFELVIDEPSTPRIRLASSRSGGKVLRETAAAFLEICAAGACKRAGVDIQDIDFFVFNTPTAWYSTFCARVLGIDPKRTIDTYELYANTGPVLTTGNLFHALAEERIRPGELVLFYSPGSISTASAAVVRWTTTALGPMPEPPKTIE